MYLLPDGREVEIRPIRADDGERLRASHARLSPQSRYRRFLGAKPALSEADTRYLVEIDGSDHFALVATAAGAEGLDEPGGAIVAVARFVRLPDDPETAEFAIVVGDSYQRQGLATELLRRLAEAALARGVHRFRATMLTDNVAIYRLLTRLAAGEIEEQRLGPVTEVAVQLRTPVGGRGGAPAMIGACAGS